MRRVLVGLTTLLLACNGGNITTNNAPPNATILLPVDGASVAALQPLSLAGVVGDTGTEASALRVTWSSARSGALFDGAPDDAAGNTAFLWDAPEVGAHRLTLTVLDPAGASAAASVDIEVVGNSAPTCEIITPPGSVDATAPVLLEGLVGDAEDAPSQLAMRWSSDLQGLLAQDPPTFAGVAVATPILTPGVHEIEMRVTDQGELSCSAIVIVDANEPPSPPAIALSPSAPTTLTDLSALITADAVDPEGTSVTYAYAWTEDSMPTALTGSVVAASALDRGELWLVTVVATDATGLSADPVQAFATIGNSPPTAPTAIVTPGAPTQAEDLVCAVDAASTDADADAVTYSYDWELDGAPTALTGDTLAWGETESGDLWTCVVTPSDDADDGPTGAASASITAGCASLSATGTGAAEVADSTALRLAAGDFTVEAWVKPSSAAAGFVAHKTGGQGWSLGATAGQLTLESGGSVLTATSAIPVGDWTHVAATYDAGSGLATLWISGANAGSGAIVAPLATDTAPLRIGSAPAGSAFDGLIDDVRLSGLVRYSGPFVPASQLGADASTLAWWGFEEAGGGVAKDLSAGGYDATLLAPAVFELSDSTCGNDQAPTAPAVAASPLYPLVSEDLECALTTPSVDPEGGTVTYAGQWLVDGAASGQAFASFPATLSSANTAEGEEWTCSVMASDGGQLGPAGTDSVFVGSMPIGTLLVVDPSSPAATNITFTPPVAGLVRVTMDNPDASRDGAFTIDTLGFGVTWLFTGARDWAYDGVTVAGWATTDVEFNLDPSVGTVTFDVDYVETSGIDNTGPDTLTLDFVYGATLDVAAATFVLGSDVGPQEVTLAQTTATFAPGERLLLATAQCGFGGGGHGVYADGDGQPNNDGVARIDTGFTGDCLIPLQSRPIGAGTWILTLANEDDFFSDNTDQREVNVYRYTP